MKWIHLTDAKDRYTYIFEIYSLLQEHEKNHEIYKYGEAIHNVSLAIYFNLLDLNQRLRDLLEYVKANQQETNISDMSNVGYALKMHDDKNTYCVINGVTSYFAMHKSLMEYTKKFGNELYKLRGKNFTIKTIQRIDAIANPGNSWYDLLDKKRNNFIHDYYPYVAIELNEDNKYNLLILCDCTSQAIQNEEFIKIDTINNYLDSYNNFIKAYIEHLKKFLEET